MKNTIVYPDIVVQPLYCNKYKVLKSIEYKDIVIPKGYKTNGADIPRVFWSIFPPNASDILPAVIVHDFLCDKGEYVKADKYFEDILVQLGVSKFKVCILVQSVKLYHKLRYKTKY